MKNFLLLITLMLIVLTSAQLWMTKGRTGQEKVLAQAEIEQKMAIGGDFTLVDQSGKTVHAADFHGRVMLVYFGFTHCPDICPVSVATMSKAMEQLKDRADQVAPVFITIDPERDTPQALKDYLGNFDKRMIGLTGTPEQVKAVAEAYKAYFAKHDIPWSEESPGDDHDHHRGNHDVHDAHEHLDDNYTVDHSGYIYMMEKDGTYVRIFPYNVAPEELAHAIEHHLQ